MLNPKQKENSFVEVVHIVKANIKSLPSPAITIETRFFQ